MPQIWTTYEVLPGYSVTLGTEWFCEWVGEVASDASETSNMVKNAKVAIQYKRTSDKIANMQTQIESSMGTLKGHSSFSLKDLEADITNMDKIEAGNSL